MSSATKFTQLGLPTALRLIGNDDLQARALGVFSATQVSGVKSAVLDDGSAFRKAMADQIAAQLQGKKTISLRQSFEPKLKDFSVLAEKLMAEAIRKAKSADPAKILQVLRKIDGYGSVTGAMRWTDSGEQSYGAVGIYSVRDGKWESIVRSDTW